MWEKCRKNNSTKETKEKATKTVKFEKILENVIIKKKLQKEH